MPGLGVSLPAKVYLLVCGLCFGLIAYCGVTYTTIRDVNVGGRYYQQIEQSRDLIADVHSPSNCIVESYLLTLHMANEVEQQVGAIELQGLVSELEKLKKDFRKQHEIWSKTLPDDEVKQAVTAECYGPAVRFYEVACEQFIPACYAGDVDVAKNLVRHDLRVHYDVHRAAIERVALLALDRQDTLENQVAAFVGQRTTQAFILAFVISAGLAACGLWFARHIVDSLNKSAAELRADACIDLQKIGQRLTDAESASEVAPSTACGLQVPASPNLDCPNSAKEAGIDQLNFTGDVDADSTIDSTEPSVEVVSWFEASSDSDPNRN